MNPVKTIGRYTFPIASVVAIVKQDDGSYEFVLPYDVRLTLTEDEKKQYDQACEEHALIMQVWGAAKSAGLRA